MKQLYLRHILLCLCLLAGINAFAYDAYIGGIYYNISKNEASVTFRDKNYNTYTGAIIIPSSVTYNNNTYSVTSIGNAAFYNCSGLTSVTIPDGVKSIGGSAFYNCSELTSVNIPDGVTRIDSDTFNGCSNLMSITIPNSVTNIGMNAFYGCSGLTSLTIGSGVTRINTYSSVFEGCTNIITLNLNCENIENNFSRCEKLQTLTIGDNVKTISDNAFYSCLNITTLNLDCESIGNWFAGRKKLKDLTLGDNVRTIGNGAFSNCSALSSVVIPNNVTSIGNNAFGSCTSLKSITIPNNVTSIGTGVFSGCYNMISVTINNSVLLSATRTSLSSMVSIFGSQVQEYIIGNAVKKIGDYAFYGCTKLTAVTIPNSVTSIGNHVFDDCSSLTTMNLDCESIGDWFAGHQYIQSLTLGDNVKTIRQGAFNNCRGLTSVNIGCSVTSIEHDAFYCCDNLISVTIPRSVTNIANNAFHGCSGLTSIKVEEENRKYDSRNNCNAIIETATNTLIVGCQNTLIPNGVTSIGGNAFSGCRSLTSVNIPNEVTRIEEGAFYGCSGLMSITIPNSVTSIGDDAFSNCYSLTSIIIPNSVTSIGDRVFQNCGGLTSVTIPNSVTRISSWAFSECSSLTAITIPNGVTTIGDGAFYECRSLISISIPNSVTNIGDVAFYGCSSLTSITIPKSVTSIGYLNYGDYGEPVFSGCSGLTSIIVEEGNAIFDSRDNSNAIIETATNTLIAGCQNTTIPNSVTSIGYYAFEGCSSLSSITIPNSVTSIGSSSFSGCYFAPNMFVNKSSLADKNNWGATLCDEETTDGLLITNGTLIKCRPRATSVTIPKSVIRINDGAFSNCCSIKSIVVEAGNESFDSRDNCNAIVGTTTNTLIVGCKNTIVPASVTSIGSVAFAGCISLTNINIPEGVMSIDRYAFAGCRRLQKVILNSNSIVSTSRTSSTSLNSLFGNQVKEYAIGDAVTAIGDYAFYGCGSQTSIIFPNNMSMWSISPSAFYGCNAKLYVNKDTGTMFSLWALGVDPYNIGTSQRLYRPSLSVISTTQSTIKYRIDNVYPELQYACIGDALGNDKFLIAGLKPGYQQIISLTVYNVDPPFYSYNSYTTSTKATTKPLNTEVINNGSTASSISVKANNIEGDANIISRSFTMNGVEIEGRDVTICGLEPNSTYRCTYTVLVGYGNGETCSYEASEDIETKALILTTQQPKAISVGNVIVAAESNLDDAETNVGFEWRRYDWPDEIVSNTGAAYLYEGTMEGYIRNLYTEKFWKYRPYYESNAGNRYYGDWVTFDPANTNYFEPTVHTYAQINVIGNRAEVKGYAMRGTDKVTSQGFMYWPSNTSVSLRKKAASIPAGAKVVEVKGNVMIAALEDLEYETSYCYVAFVTTEEYETFYGEVQTFNTDADPVGIGGVKAAEAEVTEVARYDIQGYKLDRPQKGINIIRMSDGSTRKVLIK